MATAAGVAGKAAVEEFRNHEMLLVPHGIFIPAKGTVSTCGDGGNLPISIASRGCCNLPSGRSIDIDIEIRGFHDDIPFSVVYEGVRVRKQYRGPNRISPIRYSIIKERSAWKPCWALWMSSVKSANPN